jgi:hypothetical protein
VGASEEQAPLTAVFVDQDWAVSALEQSAFHGLLI